MINAEIITLRPRSIQMPEIQNDRKIFSLLDVTRSIQKTIAERYTSVFWVKAEMNKLNRYPHSGHCYPELVEKRAGKVIAQMRSVLWKDDCHRINHNFLKMVKTPLQDGITILFSARINFDPVHGMSLTVLDIDPVFSLGELEREKQETIGQLKAEGIFQQNKALKLPLVPQRIAIISVETSKGYADFQKVIGSCPENFQFFCLLFPSVLQGERAVESMRYQLRRIRTVISHFDVVAIIRGGGGEVGLSCFNNLQLAREIALFPIPVTTGIGHATNETVVEMVAHKNAITPTDLANFLVGKFREIAQPMHLAEEKIRAIASRLIVTQRTLLISTARFFRSVTDNLLSENRNSLKHLWAYIHRRAGYLLLKENEFCRAASRSIRRQAASTILREKTALNGYVRALGKDFFVRLNKERNGVDQLGRIAASLSPDNVLKRGYSITMKNGKAVRELGDLTEGDIIGTLLTDGSLTSQVTSVKKNGI